MNRYLLAGCCLIWLTPKPVPFFEGEIDYDVHFESKTTQTDSEKLELMFGGKEQYYIKGGSYKSVVDGQVVEMQLYDPSSNRLYIKVPESDTLVWLDAAIDRDTIFSSSVKRTGDSVLGHACDRLTISSASGTSTYFFSADFPLDSTRFSAHRYTNWAFYCAKAGAVPLKRIIETTQFKITAEATSIRPQRMDSAFFRVPAGVLLPGQN